MGFAEVPWLHLQFCPTFKRDASASDSELGGFMSTRGVGDGSGTGSAYPLSLTRPSVQGLFTHSLL